VITHVETPLVLLAMCPVTKSFRLHGIRLRHAAVGPITQCLLDNREGWRGLAKKRAPKSGSAQMHRGATPCRIYRNPVGKGHGPRNHGSLSRDEDGCLDEMSSMGGEGPAVFLAPWIHW